MIDAFNALLDQQADHSVSDGLAFRFAEGQRALQELYDAHVAALGSPPPPLSSQDGEGG